MAKEVLTEKRHKNDHHHHEESCGCGHDHHHEDACGCGHNHHHEDACGCGHDHHHEEHKEADHTLSMQRSRCIFWKTWDVHIARLRWKKRFRHCLR